MRRSVVVLPAPVSPSSTKNSPSAMSRSRSVERGVAAEGLGDVLELDVGHVSRAGCRAKLPACRVEEMRLAGSIRAQTWSPALPTKPERGAGAQHLRADLQVDDVVGAERLDDVRLDRQVAGRRLVRDQHALRPDAERQLARRRLAVRACRAARRGNAKPSAAPSTVTARRRPCSRDTVASAMFMTGLPTNCATNRLAGCA